MGLDAWPIAVISGTVLSVPTMPKQSSTAVITLVAVLVSMCAVFTRYFRMHVVQVQKISEPPAV